MYQGINQTQLIPKPTTRLRLITRKDYTNFNVAGNVDVSAFVEGEPPHTGGTNNPQTRLQHMRSQNYEA